MKFKLNIKQRGLILVCVPLAFQVLFIGCLCLLLQQAELAAQKEAHAKHATAKAERLAGVFMDAVEDLWRYAASGRTDYLEHYKQLIREWPQQVSELRELMIGSEQETKDLDEIDKFSQQVIHILEDGRKAAEEHLTGRFRLAQLASNQRLIDSSQKIRECFHKIIVSESRIEADTNKDRRRLRELVQGSLIAGFGLNVLLAIALALFYAGGITRRLDVLTDNTQRLAREESLNPTLPGDDELSRLDTVFHDMAQRLADLIHAERAIVTNAVDIICSITKSGKFIKINPAISSVLGYSPEELIDKSFLRLVTSDFVEKTESTISSLANGRDRESFETRLVHKDGRAVDVIWAAQWSESERAVFSVIHDVSQQKELERMKQDFLHMVTHDLRSPLSTVSMAAKIVLTGKAGEVAPGARELVEGIDRNSTRLIRMITDLLDLDKIEAGLLQMQYAPTSWCELTSSCIDSVGMQATSRGITVVPTEMELTFTADKDRLLQVLVNLLSNAIKYSKQGDTINLTIEQRDSAVEICVIDQGGGIPAEHLDSIFDKFRQVNADDGRKGSGIGLAVCKAIVEGHGGRIGVRSIVGKGSTFWFQIPAEQTSETA